MLLRAREEKAFGLIELLFAMVMLNVGILALVATFQSGALAIGRSAYASNASAVAVSIPPWRYAAFTGSASVASFMRWRT